MVNKKQIPFPKSPAPNADKDASKEAEYFASEDLEKVAAINDHKRKEDFKKHINWAAKTIFWIFVVCFSLIIVTWVYHLITPEKWHFLTIFQIEKLQAFVFSAALIKIGQDYLKKHT